MLKNIVNLLILYGILCQGILGTVADEDIKESSDVVSREKRVINRQPGGDVPEGIHNVPYMVYIKKLNRINCAGSILSPSIVITAAKCVEYGLPMYKVYSGSSSSVNGKRHTVLTKRIRSVYRKHRPWDVVAVITVAPHFVYNDHTRNIQLHVADLPPGVHATVSGWGFNCGTPIGTQHPLMLRSITVPTMNHEDCAIKYRGQLQIMDSEVCTFDAHKHCGLTDVGAPLVFNNQLVGIHLLGGSSANKPDVYAHLEHSEFRLWLRSII